MMGELDGVEARYDGRAPRCLLVVVLLLVMCWLN